MPQALIFNGTAGRVDIPSKSSAGGARRLLLVDFLSLNAVDGRCLVGNDLAGTAHSIRIISSTQIGVRVASLTSRTINISPALPSGEFTLEVFKNAGNTFTVNVDGAQVGSLTVASNEISTVDTYQYIGQCGNALRLNASVKRMIILDDEYINATDNTATTWGDGTLNGLTPPSCWESYSSGSTPISFTGTIPTQSFTVGQPVSVDLSGYFSGTETPFTFANTGTALTGSGLSLSSAGLLSGTATESSITGVVVTGTDAELDTAASNAFNLVVSAEAEPPEGVPVIGAITVGETTASAPFTYALGDATGFESQLDSGEITAATSPISLTGLTAGTPYQIRVRATNAAGDGDWSDYSDFTTDALQPLPSDPIIVFGADTALSFNTGGDIGLRRNLTGLSVDIYDVNTRALVLSVAGHTTDANAVMANIQNAALTAATEYRIVVLGADGSEAVFRETSQ